MRTPGARARLSRTSTAVGTTVLVLITSAACTNEPSGGPGTEVVTQVGISETYDDFDYYGPCANEPLQIGDTTFYPLLDDEIAALDRDRYAPAGSASDVTGMLRIAPPGPGDDIGTMTVYEDGVARFETDSGKEWWFNDQEHTYNWEC